jgi:protein N-terminal methyltransferase
MRNEKSLRYWANAPATVDGVLGGVEHVHEIDIRESKAFLESLDGVGRERALDCGAGIGRISKNLLCPLFKLTDVMEPFPHMLDIAKAELPSERVGEFLPTSMERADLPHTYDLITMQWVAAYLHDDALVSFLERCKAALKPGGVIFIKDNIATRNRLVDAEDNSQIRSDKQYKALFAKAGLACVKEAPQVEWPEDLYEARMYALR